MGDDFTLADCAAFPALFYGERVAPFMEPWTYLAAYLERLKRPASIERVLAEAEACMKMLPG